MDGPPVPFARHPARRARAPAHHLVTGATGFVGAALVLELLQRTRDDVVAVVRPGAHGARARFVDAITQAAGLYGVTLDPGALDRCRVVAGDVLQERCDVDPREVGEVRQVWHCAASLRYEDRYRDEIRATNVEGTRHALDLARRVGAESFEYVSTAYVAGRRAGRIPEEAAPERVDTNNEYERSKIDAERLVSSAPDLRARIFRPSVVVGHSRTLAATTFSGFYGFLRQLVQFRGVVDRTQQGLLERTALRIRLDPDARINLVPVDLVARETARIGLSDHGPGIFHLTHPAPPTVGTATRTLFALLGLREPLFVESAGALEWLDQRFDERLDFYGSYIRGDKQFERHQADAAMGGAPEAAVVYDVPTLQALARWYLAVLEEERRAVPVAR